MEKNETNNRFALNRENFILLAIAAAVIIVGFVLMSGGANPNSDVFNADMFNFRRLTLAPLMVLGGFVFIIYAIMKKPKA